MLANVKDSEIAIKIRRQLDGSVAETTLAALSNLYWGSGSGGVLSVQKSLPGYFVIGHVHCTEIDGEIGHSCKHGPPPHEIRVLITKKDNPENWGHIEKIVGPRPKTTKAKPYRPDSDAKKIVSALLKNKSHPAIVLKKEKIVIMPKNLKSVCHGCTDNTRRARSKKLQNKIRQQMKGVPGFTETLYGYYLAYIRN